jgi:hypothetical protein
MITHGLASCGCDNPADTNSLFATATTMLGNLLGNNSAAVSSMSAEGVGLRTALMLLLPAMYIGSSFFFHVAEQELVSSQQQKSSASNQKVEQQSNEEGTAAGQVLSQGTAPTLQPALSPAEATSMPAASSNSSSSMSSMSIQDAGESQPSEPVPVGLSVPARK